tara:strand:+ start:19919 stop:21244 length:1326 start_codon:yes stop_codon:yes gene_type:complete
MAASASSDTSVYDGWSDSSASIDSSESHNSTSKDGLPATIAESETTETAFNTDDVCDLFRRWLEKAGVLPRNWKLRPGQTFDSDDAITPSSLSLSLPYPSLFTHLASSVVQADLIKHWIVSRDKEYFRLHLPSGLDNPFFVTSLVTQLAESQPSLRVTPAILPHDGAGAGATERLLMSLCFHMLSSPNADWDFSELLGDIKDAFSGRNRCWRESLLWALLQCLLTTGEDKHLLLALSLPFDPNGADTFPLTTVKRLLRLTRSTERTIQIVLILEPGRIHGSSIETSYTLNVNMADSTAKESLRIDMLSWLAAMPIRQPLLRVLGDEIVTALSQRLSQPLSIFSTLCALHNRQWLSEHQLTTDLALVCGTSSILTRTPEADRLLIVDSISVLRYCERPLAIRELADALAIAQCPSSVRQLKEKSPLDLEFDLRHSLSGLVHV